MNNNLIIFIIKACGLFSFRFFGTGGIILRLALFFWPFFDLFWLRIPQKSI